MPKKIKKSFLLRIHLRSLTLKDLRTAYERPVDVELSQSELRAVESSAKVVAKMMSAGKTVYGINTGFGLLARTKIPPHHLETLQKNLVLSHMSGVGPALPDSVVRLVLALKILGLARGYSGVSLGVVRALQRLLEEEMYPIIPAQGSVGASGDLAPLAHLAGALLGVGFVRHRNQTLTAIRGLKKIGLRPLCLGPKEGLALVNGTQVSTALALAGLFEIEKIFAAATVAGALSVDAARGSDGPFDKRIQQVRGQPGQIRVASALSRLLKGSSIRASHIACDRVQDPYSLRCQPQVMGAVLDLLGQAAATLGREAIAVSDNPLVFAKTGDVLSGGNFHAEYIAFASDIMALAISEIGSMSERRLALLMDEKLSRLPTFLVRESGLNSGFMSMQVTAAALVAENKLLAHPASVDSIPTSANQEDHVSMATHGARRLLTMSENAKNIVAIELLASAQGIDFHVPLKTSHLLSPAHAMIRQVSKRLENDRNLAPDIAAVADMISRDAFREFVPGLLPSEGV